MTDAALTIRVKEMELNFDSGTEMIDRSEGMPFVLSLSDDEDNSLRITIALAMRGEKDSNERSDPPENETDERIDAILKDAYPVYDDMNNVYEIVFDGYIIYQCRNESYTGADDGEIMSGKYLVVYGKSKLLDYYQSVIIDPWHDDEIAGRKHYGIKACNHVIDVISNEPPIIRKVDKGKVFCDTR